MENKTMKNKTPKNEMQENETPENEMQDNRPQELEEAFEQLNQIVDKLESPELSLEESFQSYERGMRLLKQCNDTIDRVEKKVQVLNSEGGLDEF